LRSEALLRPGEAPAVDEEVAVLVAPVLSPMLDDEGPLHLPVIRLHEHTDEVLQRDVARLFVDDVHVLGPPALVRAIGGEAGAVSDRLDEIEARAKGPGHGQDRAAIALERSDAPLLQALPS